MTYPLTPRAERIARLTQAIARLTEERDGLVRAEYDDLTATHWDDCGTDTAYKRHRAQGEHACAPCLAAHSAANRSTTPPERRHRRPSEIPACGTNSAYRRHYQLGEECEVCATAETERWQARKAKAS